MANHRGDPKEENFVTLLSEGYTCSKCGAEHKFASWIYTQGFKPSQCECSCGHKTVFQQGEVVDQDGYDPTEE